MTSEIHALCIALTMYENTSLSHLHRGTCRLQSEKIISSKIHLIHNYGVFCRKPEKVFALMMYVMCLYLMKFKK